MRALPKAGEIWESNFETKTYYIIQELVNVEQTDKSVNTWVAYFGAGLTNRCSLLPFLKKHTKSDLSKVDSDIVAKLTLGTTPNMVSRVEGDRMIFEYKSGFDA